MRRFLGYTMAQWLRLLLDEIDGGVGPKAEFFMMLGEETVTPLGWISVAP